MTAFVLLSVAWLFLIVPAAVLLATAVVLWVRFDVRLARRGSRRSYGGFPYR